MNDVILRHETNTLDRADKKYMGFFNKVCIATLSKQRDKHGNITEKRLHIFYKKIPFMKTKFKTCILEKRFYNKLGIGFKFYEEENLLIDGPRKQEIVMWTEKNL